LARPRPDRDDLSGSGTPSAGRLGRGQRRLIRASAKGGIRLPARTQELVRAISESDEAAVERAVKDLTRSHRIFAPLTFVLGALIMLLEGVRVLFTNWRLSLLQALPAMWIWAAMLDLKVHLVKGRSFTLWYGPGALGLVLAVTAITAAVFFLNAVFAMAVAVTRDGGIRQAFRMARKHSAVAFAWGSVLGLALGVSVVVVPRWGLGWFTLSLGIVIAVLMLTYVAVPARMVGIRTKRLDSRKDQITTTVVSSAVGAIVCTPPYVLGRVGLVLLGSRVAVLGGVLLAVGLALQAGAQGAVKAIKVSSKLVVHPDPDGQSEQS
jgi:hypothetical protein